MEYSISLDQFWNWNLWEEEKAHTLVDGWFANFSNFWPILCPTPFYENMPPPTIQHSSSKAPVDWITILESLDWKTITYSSFIILLLGWEVGILTGRFALLVQLKGFDHSTWPWGWSVLVTLTTECWPRDGGFDETSLLWASPEQIIDRCMNFYTNMPTLRIYLI